MGRPAPASLIAAVMRMYPQVGEPPPDPSIFDRELALSERARLGVKLRTQRAEHRPRAVRPAPEKPPSDETLRKLREYSAALSLDYPHPPPSSQRIASRMLSQLELEIAERRQGDVTVEERGELLSIIKQAQLQWVEPRDHREAQQLRPRGAATHVPTERR